MKKLPIVSVTIRRYEPDWGSHIPILTRVMLVSRGPILELGIGVYSTPVLHYFSQEQHRQLYSYEDNKDWVDAHKYWNGRYHHIEHINDWDIVPIEKYHWGVIFIDHLNTRRSIDGIRAARYADFVVIHDTNGRFNYEYHTDKVAPFYKYKYTYDKIMNHTTVFSNFIPVHTLWTI